MEDTAFSLQQLKKKLMAVLGYQPEEEVIEILYYEILQDIQPTGWKDSQIIERFQEILRYFL